MGCSEEAGGVLVDLEGELDIEATSLAAGRRQLDTGLADRRGEEKGGGQRNEEGNMARQLAHLCLGAAMLTW